MTAESDGFLGRWARRKAQARSGATLPPEPESAPPAPSATAVRLPVQPLLQGVVTPAAIDAAADSAASPAPAVPVEPVLPAPPLSPPTLQDAQLLTPSSDFRPFVARAVAPEVRNAAFKQLFADPHFNVMDGLDIYIDDYSRPDPLPLAVARELLAAHFPSPPAVTESARTVALPETEPPAGATASVPEEPSPARQPSDPAP